MWNVAAWENGSRRAGNGGYRKSGSQGSSSAENRWGGGLGAAIRNGGAAVQRGHRPARRGPGGAGKDGARPASVWAAFLAQNSRRSISKRSVPLVFGISASGGDAALFHGELQLPSPLHGGYGRPNLCVDSGGNRGGGLSFAQSGVHRRHSYQGQCQHEKEGKRSHPRSLETVRANADGGGKRGPGGAWQGAL